MKQIAFPIAAILALSACARVEPIDLNEVEEVEPLAIENVVGDAAITSSLNWTVDGTTATLAGESGAVLAFACAEGSLDIARFAEGLSGAGTLTFGNSAALASVAVAADAATTEGAQRYEATLAPGDIGDDLVAVFAAGLPVDVTMTGVDPLIAPANGEVSALVSDCIARAADSGDAATSNAIG